MCCPRCGAAPWRCHATQRSRDGARVAAAALPDHSSGDVVQSRRSGGCLLRRPLAESTPKACVEIGVKGEVGEGGGGQISSRAYSEEHRGPMHGRAAGAGGAGGAEAVHIHVLCRQSLLSRAHDKL